MGVFHSRDCEPTHTHQERKKSPQRNLQISPRSPIVNFPKSSRSNSQHSPPSNDDSPHKDTTEPLIFPLLNRLGCELLAVIYMQFNPVIPLKQRMETTKRTIEVFDEIFFSVGEEEKGFSISLSQNYTNIGRINEIRTETFGKLGLLEKEYPHEVIFPFETSHIHRFFDFSPFLQNSFKLDDSKKISTTPELFRKISSVEFSPKEKKVYSALVEHPTATTQQIGDLVNLSRHTVARMKKNFFEDGLLQTLILPNLKTLRVEILTFYSHQLQPQQSTKHARTIIPQHPLNDLFRKQEIRSSPPLRVSNLSKTTKKTK